MNCGDAQELLSAYHDGELAAAARRSVADHVERCTGCTAELAIFERLSAMAKGLEDPELPTRLWAEIEERLGEPRADATMAAVVRQRSRFLAPRYVRLLAAAAVILAAVGIAWFAAGIWRGSGHHPTLAVDFGRYLEEFQKSPEGAQEVLLAKYDGKAVDFAEAAKRLGYRPLAAEGLPPGYSLEAVHLLKMPCCVCVQCVCRRDDGEAVAIFEHQEQQPVWFGDRPSIDTRCHGQSCRVTQVDNHLAASWQAGGRHITVIGARDLEEIASLISHFQHATRRS